MEALNYLVSKYTTKLSSSKLHGAGAKTDHMLMEQNREFRPKPMSPGQLIYDKRHKNTQCSKDGI